MEVVGGVAAVSAVADQLLKACLTGYQLFTAAQNVGKDLTNYLYHLEVSQQKLKDWIAEVESDGKRLHDFIDPNTPRYRVILQTLARIAGIFADVEQLKRKYGISRVDEHEDIDAKSAHPEIRVEALDLTSASSAERPGREGTFRGLLSTVREKWRSRSQNPAPRARASPNPGEKHEAVVDPTRALVPPDPTAWEHIGLDITVPGLDKWAEDMKKTAAKYQQMMPALQRCKWAYTGGKQPQQLVHDLEAYVRNLESLTKHPLERLKPPTMAMLQIEVEFGEFKVPRQLPYPRLSNFCGRENILHELQDYLTISTAGKGTCGAWRRAVVVLQGMGGLGKTQVALEYAYRNSEEYAAVFWVDATDQSTICDSGRQILQMLIAHYSTKYRGERTCDLANIATDLGIPGQVKNDGTLVDVAAKTPWPSVKRWLAREGNSRWCLVVDGLTVPKDEDRMLALLPACEHGHIIVTSRVPVADSKLIDVPEMDEISSLRLLLRESFETTSEESREAAKSIAKELGYLPLALSQAAAYVAKCALDLVEYLKRLTVNMVKYISQKIPRYPHGVVSCWQLSVQALMESKMAHSVDLLRICSFLSPEGVSKELLVRGLSAMEGYDSDRSHLDDAIDNLILYALIKPRSPNNKEGQIYWVHPLIRHWAQETYYDGQSMVLETDKTQLRKLHTNGRLKAIILVGCSLHTRFDNRQACEWSFDRRNITHILLCLNTYIPECDFAAHGATATVEVARALANFAGLKMYWGEYRASADLAMLSISLYERLMPPNPPPHLEAEMLVVKQYLLTVNIGKRKLTTYGVILEDVLSRQRQLLAPGDADLLWTESLKATDLKFKGSHAEALDQYRRCVDKMAEALHPGHPANMATVGNLADLYYIMGDYGNAEKFYNQSVKLWLEHRGPDHYDTQRTLDDVAKVMGLNGNPEGQLECLKIAAQGSETTYGLANRRTIQALHKLESCYRLAGRDEEAEAVGQKILEGKRVGKCRQTDLMDKEQSLEGWDERLVCRLSVGDERTDLNLE